MKDTFLSRHRAVKRATVVTALLILAVTVVFAGGEHESTAPGQTDRDPALEQWLEEAQLGPYLPQEEDWNEVVRKAKQEGKVVIYSSTSRIHRVKELFEKTYGIELEAYDIETMQIQEKVRREQTSAVFNVDVVRNDATATMYQFVQQEMLWKYVPPRVDDVIPPHLKNWLVTHVWGPGQVIYYNTEYWSEGMPPLDTLWDFTREDWRGKVIVTDPLQSGLALKSMALLTYGKNADALADTYEQEFGKPIDLAEHENAGFKFIADLVSNDAVIVSSGDETVDTVGARGQSSMPPLGMFAHYSKLRTIKERNLALGALLPDVIEPFESFDTPPGSPLHGAVMGITARAPHPYAARVLIDFLLGDETGDGGNAPWHKLGNWSPRTDVKTVAGDVSNPAEVNTLLDAPPPEEFDNVQQKLRDFWLLITS